MKQISSSMERGLVLKAKAVHLNSSFALHYLGKTKEFLLICKMDWARLSLTFLSILNRLAYDPSMESGPLYIILFI